MARGSPMKLLAIAMATCATASLATGATVAKKKNSPEDYVELHNAARAVVGTGLVSWDAEAARHAAKRAAAACAGLRSRSSPAVGGGYGENVYHCTPRKKARAAAADAMCSWTAPAAWKYMQVVWPGSNWPSALATAASSLPAATNQL